MMAIERKDCVLVIGIGNRFRSDDAVGLHVAGMIAGRGIPGVVVREEYGEGVSLMEAWTPFARVIAIDATSSGAPAGTIRRLDAQRGPVPSEFFHYSTHAFGLAEAVEMARAMGSLPQSLVVYGIEGKKFSSGQGLSEQVRRAADTVAQQVQEEIAADSAPSR